MSNTIGVARFTSMTHLIIVLIVAVNSDGHHALTAGSLGDPSCCPNWPLPSHPPIIPTPCVISIFMYAVGQGNCPVSVHLVRRLSLLPAQTTRGE